MFKIAKNIKDLYILNLAEGEGLGSAYEYHVKIKKIEKFFESVGMPQSILIAGLPEKYGLSLDFFSIAHSIDAEVIVVDEREEVITRLRNTLLTLKEKKIFSNLKAGFHQISNLTEINKENILHRRFDLALSSEVIQRLDRQQNAYVSNILTLADHFALFAPNKGNQSHAKRSGLESLSLEDLKRPFEEGKTNVQLFDSGYLDMPPFPPGLSRSEAKRERASRNKFESFIMNGLQLYGLLETLAPEKLKQSKAHIVFVIGSNKSC